MSFLDPIESGINSLLRPLTSIFGIPEPATMGSSNSTPSPEDSSFPSATATLVTPSLISDSASATRSVGVFTITATPTSSTKSSARSSTESDSTSTTESSTSSSQTTLSTSAITSSSSESTSSTSSSSSSTSTTSTSSSITTPAAPPATSSSPPPPFNAQPSSSSNSSDSALPTAGIIIAIVFGVALLISIIWLICRFCPPVRRRIDAWSSRRTHDRTYREALDGPAVPDKDYASSLESQTSQSRSMNAAAHLGVPVSKRPFSFLNVKTAPQKQGYSWQISAGQPSQGTVHQQYVSPTSVDPDDRGAGLGLGRVSVLRNHSLLRKAGYDVPLMPGPSMTHTQAAIANNNPHLQRYPLTQLPMEQVQQPPQVRRKPLPAAVETGQSRTMAVPGARTRFSYEAPQVIDGPIYQGHNASQVSVMSHAQAVSQAGIGQSMPNVMLQHNPAQTQSPSQIGLAMGSPARYYGVAK